MTATPESLIKRFDDVLAEALHLGCQRMVPLEYLHESRDIADKVVQDTIRRMAHDLGMEISKHMQVVETDDLEGRAKRYRADIVLLTPDHLTTLHRVRNTWAVQEDHRRRLGI